MKKLYSIVLFLFFSSTIFSQGIAIQGIARDNASSAITSSNLTFTFSITKSDNTVLYSETQSITTDNFGVFSHIISTGNPVTNTFNGVDFSVPDLKLKVSVNYNSNIIEVYSQTLQYTPYAHFSKKAALATNSLDGVPTGAILPFSGATAPAGWVLCNGQSLTSITGSEALIAIVGNNAPNLQGMFLRGTGVSPVNSQSGPSLRGTQADENKQHLHEINITSNNNGQHNHTNGDYQYVIKKDGNGTATSTDFSNGEPNIIQVEPMLSSGNHNHTIQGNSNNSGATESRPVNYGVHYIIKL